VQHSLFCLPLFAFVVLFLQYYAKRLAGKNVSEMTYFVSSGMSNLNQLNFVKVYVFVCVCVCGSRLSLIPGTSCAPSTTSRSFWNQYRTSSLHELWLLANHRRTGPNVQCSWPIHR